MASLKIASSTEIKIEKGVPMPPSSSGNLKYPFRSMAVGDSFFVAGKSVGTMAANASPAARRIGGGTKFTCRAENGGVRVWRIS